MFKKIHSFKKKRGKKGARFHGARAISRSLRRSGSIEVVMATASSMRRPRNRRGKGRNAPIGIIDRQPASTTITTTTTKTSTSSSTTTAVASALRAGLGVFLFAAVGLWSWDPLKALLLERELLQKKRELFGGELSTNFSGGGDGGGEELRARARVALAAKANLNAAVTVALLSAPASLGNTVGIAVQRMLGAALGCLAAAGVSALGHGAAAAAAALRGGTTTATTPPPTPSSSPPVPATPAPSPPPSRLSAVVLGTLAVYLGQRARVQYGAQLFGVSLFFVLAQSGASPREASELALSRGAGVVAGAALAAVLAVAVLPQSAARGVGVKVEGALLGVADLAEAAMSGGSGGGSGGGDEKGDDERENEKDDEKLPPSLPLPSTSSPSTATAAAAAAKRVLSTISELDDCLAWAPAETAVRAPTREPRRLLFYLPSLRAALGLSVSETSKPPVPVEEVTSLSLALRAATSTLTTVGAVRAQRLPRSVREAVSSVAGRGGGGGGGGGKGNKGGDNGGGDEKQNAFSASDPASASHSNEAPDTFELISPIAIAAWEALADAWRDREKLRRRRKRAGEEEDVPSSPSFSGAEADAAVAALTAAAASAAERARARAAAARSLALKETAAGPGGSYRGMFERILPAPSTSSTLGSTSTSTTLTPSTSASSTFRLAARARARFLAEVALVSKMARDAERALGCLRAAVEAL